MRCPTLRLSRIAFAAIMTDVALAASAARIVVH